MKRVLLPNGEEMPLHEEPVYLLRWELVTTARSYDAPPDGGESASGERRRAVRPGWVA